MVFFVNKEIFDVQTSCQTGLLQYKKYIPESNTQISYEFRDDNYAEIISTYGDINGIHAHKSEGYTLILEMNNTHPYFLNSQI